MCKGLTAHFLATLLRDDVNDVLERKMKVGRRVKSVLVEPRSDCPCEDNSDHGWNISIEVDADRVGSDYRLFLQVEPIYPYQVKIYDTRGLWVDRTIGRLLERNWNFE